MKISNGLSMIAFAAMAGIVSGGCNIGMTESGGSPEEVKQAFDKLPLEERAKSIMASPASEEFKKQRIKEMYEKEGKTPPADISGGSPRTGTAK